jgi:hypothetical protein
MKCAYCGQVEVPFNKGVFCPKCKKDRLDNLPMERYIEALKRFRAFIVAGGKLEYYDDTTLGNKNTECTWGLCCEDPKMWPEKMDHTFPHSFEAEGRSTPLLPPEGHGCPMDKREKKSRWGCFYHCRIFQGPRPTREEAIKLYDLSLERLRK